MPLAVATAAVATAIADAVAAALAEAVTSPIAEAVAAAIDGAITADVPLHADHRRHQMVQWRIELVPRFRLWRGL